LLICLSGLLAALAAPLTGSAQSRVFAPYIDISLSNNNLAQISQASGIKVFTLAFIVGNGCENSWFGVIPVSSDTTYKPLIDALRSAGGDVIISFGGASGVELAGTCTNVSNIQAQYQAVINKYGVKMLDFDIEGAAVADTAAIDRRNQALAALQKANSGLVISYTLPVEPGPVGLDQFCLNLLSNAKSHGVNVAVVNIMTMDFGGTANPKTMGQNAISAADETISQLQSIGLNAKVGITPMIGLNDTSPEVFTVTDAQTVLNYAKSNSTINRLAFWSVARDQSCPGGGAQVSDDCSGISQSMWAFSHVFEGFSGSGGGGGPTQVANLTFSPGGGTYSAAQSVTISTSTSGASIRYTTDGSTPTETHGTIYSTPVSISKTTTLEAIGYKSGDTDSNITSATYTISTGGGGGGSTLNFEAESLSYTGSGATTSVQTDKNSSGGKWVELAGNSTGDHIDFTVPSVPAGTYQLKMEWKGLNNRGILQLSVDGANLGAKLDQYSTGQTYPTTTFGNVTFAAAGSHTIRLTVTGKNASSKGELLSADKFTFVGQ